MHGFMGTKTLRFIVANDHSVEALGVCKLMCSKDSKQPHAPLTSKLACQCCDVQWGVHRSNDQQGG